MQCVKLPQSHDGTWMGGPELTCHSLICPHMHLTQANNVPWGQLISEHVQCLERFHILVPCTLLTCSFLSYLVPLTLHTRFYLVPEQEGHLFQCPRSCLLVRNTICRFQPWLQPWLPVCFHLRMQLSSPSSWTELSADHNVCDECQREAWSEYKVWGLYFLFRLVSSDHTLLNIQQI